MARKKPKPSARRAWILGALLLGTVLAYAPVVSNELVNYDDDYYITANPNVRLGLSWEGLRWAATTSYGANWFPLTWLTWLAEYELFGLDPVMFHTTNLLLHLAATLILFHVFERMTGSRFRSAIVAAVFALHPMHVESVAWAAERKDVLSGLFWMLTMWAYVRYVDKPTLGRYAWVPIYLVLGLMAKPMLVTLPFALLLLDVWPLRRPPDTMFRKLILEKLPLVAIVTVSSIVTFYVQQAGGAVQALQTFSFRVRVANALIAYVVYLKKAILPTDLSVYYPHPGENVSMGLAFACGLALAAISAAVLWIAARDRERDYLAVGWFWYLGTLVPVIGLVQVGMQATADRYTYLPYIGLSILGAWGGAELVEHFRLPKLARVALSAAVLVAFAASAHARTEIWKDSVTLFEQALAVTEGNSLAHINLGYAYVARGRLDRAEEHLTAAVGLAPGAVEAHHGLGLLRRRQFRADDAIEHYREALWLDATSSQTHRELGNLLLTLGDLEQARTHLSEALALDPRNPDNHTNRGLLYLEEGEIERALELFEAATVLDSGHAQAHNNWGVALSSLGREDEAIPHFRHAVAVRPDYLEARLSWGLAEMRRGEMKNAVEQLKKALALAPDDGDVHLALGQALEALGDSSGASSHLNRAAAARRDDPATLHELGVRLAQSGSLPEAIDALERSLQLAPNRAETHVSLTMALGALGRFDEAIMGYQRAIELQPNFADAYNSWGVALASQGRVSEALPLFEKALALAPGFAAAHLNWGRALAEQGPKCPFVRPYAGLADGTTSQMMAFRNGDVRLTLDDAPHLIDLYDAGISQMDDEVGRLVTYLKETEIWNDTLFVLTSDHGEEFLEHDGVLHGKTQYQEVQRIPLLVHGPGLVPARVEAPASLIDVMPTLLDLLGVSATESMDGLSLRTAWREDSAALPDRFLFAEADHNNTIHDVTRSVRYKGFKLRFNRDTGEAVLHDLSSDPGELEDASANFVSSREQLMKELVAFMEKPERETPTITLTPEELERLKASATSSSNPHLTLVGQTRLIPLTAL